jgi:membrane-bound lytic murein transglycosylase B
MRLDFSLLRSLAGPCTACVLVAAGPAHTAPVAVAAPSAPAAASSTVIVPYADRPEVQQWAHDIAKRQHLEPTWVMSQLAQARFQPKVAKFIMPAPSGTAKNWTNYRARFIDAVRIRQGVQWWNTQQDWLTQAETRWGVPASVIVAIVGVETIYGRQTGNFRILDALTTLGFDFPSGRSDRRQFFRDELAAYLQWCHREGRDATSVLGSYAGAIGLPQFMPSSILKYAVDFNGDGHIDLMQQPADVIGSVAHYLAQFGWQPHMPTHYTVRPPTDAQQLAELMGPDIQPTFTVAQMQARGALVDQEGQHHVGPLAFVSLQNGNDAPLYLAATQNFYTITRYNWSAYYAMAVIELARELRQARAMAAAPQQRPRTPDR